MPGQDLLCNGQIQLRALDLDGVKGGEGHGLVIGRPPPFVVAVVSSYTILPSQSVFRRQIMTRSSAG